MKVYGIKGFSPGNNKVLQDSRRWKKTCPISWKGHTHTCFADCKGSWKSTKQHCPFKIQFGVMNTTQFEKSKREVTCKDAVEKTNLYLAMHAGT